MHEGPNGVNDGGENGYYGHKSNEQEFSSRG